MDTKDNHSLPSDDTTRLADTNSPTTANPAETTGSTTDPASTTSPTYTGITEEFNTEDIQVVQVGSVLKNRFVLEEMLGRGGMGVVYKAQDMRKVEAMDRDPYIAVKVLSKDFQANPDSFIALQRETKKAQQLAHPNIVTVYDFDRDGPNVFMTMELLQGEPLDHLIRRIRPSPLPAQEALSIIEQMSRALAYAHSENIVHSDFKPGNVFLTSKNVVKVVDFGIARAAKDSDRVVEDATIFDPGSLGALTPTYASCEMLEYGTPDPRDDVYGLAVVAYELLAGSHPFSRKPATYARDLGMKAERPKEISKEVWQAISHGLEFERDKRTINATQFLQEMSGPRSGRDSRFPSWAYPVTAAAGLLMAVALVTLMFFGNGDGQPEIVLEETSSLAEEQRTRIEDLLEVAEVHGLVGRYIEPSGSSAYDAYQQVLALHENNKQAWEGLHSLGDQMVVTIQKLLDDGKQDQAEILITRGLEKLPQHEGLQALRESF
ncbi:MAG: serine/threonine protein kinase [Candidatus Thiodiazotropha taylori]|nr:serine/threonine protein kinase [Candidatus Thiodiazotropha taylori]